MPDIDPTLAALDRIEAKLPTVDPGHVEPAAFNAMSVTEHVRLQEDDPARYAASLQAAANAPSPAPRYAAAPDDVIPAATFDASQLADIAEQAPELYQRSIEHWTTHDQTGDAA